MSKNVKRIKCFAYFDTLKSTDNRTNNPAAYTKSSYIFDCFERLGYEVEVLSASGTLGKNAVKGKKSKIGKSISLTTLNSLGRGSKVKNALARLFLSVEIFLKLLFFVKKGDLLWVYHSLPLMKFVRVLKALKKITLLLEVEEIYGDVNNCEKTVNKELKFFNCADGYIFCTGLLNDRINTKGKSYAVAHGSYTIKPQIADSFNDGKIHIVYAGTFSLQKGGVYTAINTAKFLDEAFHLHILGSGSDSEIKKVKALIKEIPENGCKVTYDGCFYGEKYSAFLQKCHIGLSTQNPNEAFCDSSFPSKILVYMANGLRVVSVRIPAVEKSAVGNDVYFYDSGSPRAVADSIKSVDFALPYGGRELINKLDRDFCRELEALIETLKDSDDS